MKGGFDLYGTYYPDINDAINAEISQCNEIENANNRMKIQRLEKQLPERVEFLVRKIQELENRINQLESKNLLP